MYCFSFNEIHLNFLQSLQKVIIFVKIWPVIDMMTMVQYKARVAVLLFRVKYILTKYTFHTIWRMNQNKVGSKHYVVSICHS